MKKGYWVVRANINNFNEYSKYIEIVKQKVKDDALGIDMNYKNISFQ